MQQFPLSPSWPTPPVGGTQTYPLVVPTTDVVAIGFITPASMSDKSGSIQTIQFPGPPNAYGGTWQWSGALNTTPGDLTTNIAAAGQPSTVFANATGPLITFRGGPNPTGKGTAQYPVLLPSTKYWLNMQAKPGCPMAMASIRVQLSAPR